MTRRRILKFSLLILITLTAYFSIVAVWAMASISTVLPDKPVVAPALLLPPERIEALLKIEDPRFYSHVGVDLSNGQGLTTITSSLAREKFLLGADLPGIRGGLQSVYRAIFACCKKVDFGRDVMAVVLNANVPKDRQLSLYLTEVYMGSLKGVQIRGLGQASELYFNKSLGELTDHEFAGLIGMIKAPNDFHPVKNRPLFDARWAKVEAVISGRCRPDGVFDTNYDHCAAQ